MSEAPRPDAVPAGRGATLERVPPPLLVLTGVVSLQVGAAVAKSLFEVVPPTTLVMLRFLAAAVLLVVVARPVLRARTRREWLLVAGFGVCLAVMNFAIYQAMARIPIGMAVTIEFLGPLAVALLGSRRVLDLLWVLLAGSGVLLLAFSPAPLDPVGVLLALLAAGCWAAYILLSARVGRSWSGVSGLAVASTVGVVLLIPPGVVLGGEALLRPEILLLGLLVGVMSSAVPYSVELVALRRMPAAVFGVLMSLGPAAAALSGLLLLGEQLSAVQWAAVGCVVLASTGSAGVSAGGTGRRSGRLGLRPRRIRPRRTRPGRTRSGRQGGD